MDASFLLPWLGGTLLPLGALWLVFRWVLRRERCFGYNRALLLLAPLLAAGLPLLPLPALPAWLVAPGAPRVALPSVLLPALPVATPAAASGAGWNWAIGLYAVGIGLALGRLAYQGWRLRRATRRLPREARPGYTLAYTGGQLPTSSFGRTVFWDDTAGLTPAEAAPVLAHELAHVRQGHSYDLLWLELWRAVLWPNPFAHLLLPALRLTHELLADRAALATPAPVAYPALLARLAARGLIGGRQLPLLQAFTFSFTLTRLAMLQNQVPVRRWKQWLVLPVLGGLWLAACQSAPYQPAPSSAPKPGAVADQATPPPPPTLTTVPVSAVDAAGKIYTYVEQMPALAGNPGITPIIQQILANLTYPAGGHKDGKVFASFTVQADGRVSDPSIVIGLAPAYDEAVLAAIKKLPRFVPGRQDGKAVAVSFTVPVLFKENQ